MRGVSLPRHRVSGAAQVLWRAGISVVERAVFHCRASGHQRARGVRGGCGPGAGDGTHPADLGLHFHPRDAEADRATPPAGRPPVKIGNTYLRMRRGVVEADLVNNHKLKQV